jgi:hypothetical protein
MLPVLHGAARAITPNEFAEALYAVSPPRFPSARGVRRRPVCTSALLPTLPLFLSNMYANDCP